MSKYDLVIYRQDGGAVGYMCAWGEGTDAPVIFASEPPDLQISTSTSLTKAGGSFTARDAAPPYPIEVNNWQGGAGQKSYDHENALDSSYWSSECIDVTQEGEFGLGPRVLVFADTTIKNVCGFALGTFWAAFEPAGTGDDRNQLRFLARLTTTSGVGDYLPAVDSTALDLVTYENLDDLSLGDTTYDIATGDLLYSPSTGEVVEIASGSAGAYVVTRGEAGTTPAVHTAGEQWIVLRWIPITYNLVGPTQQVTSICSDGEYVYASFHTIGTDNGSVWKGKPNATDWTSFSATVNITDLTVCAGYIYGAQDNEATNARTTCGYFTSAGVFTPISLQGALTPRMSTAGLTSVGNYVYWGTTDGFNSSVFRVQHSSENLFELVSNLPPGFTLSDLIGHLGNLYAGGYIDTLATSVHDSDMPQYEGALYLLGADNVVLRLFRIKDASDSRIKGLAAAGPYIICLANEDTYIFDTSTGGYSHYANTPNNVVEWETETFDWQDGGYISIPDDIALEGIQYLDYGADILSPDVAGQDWLLFDSASDEGFTQEYDYDLLEELSYHVWRCNAKKWRRMTVVEGAVPATEVITMPTTQGTIEFWVGSLRSQGGAVVVGMDTKEVRVHLQGVVAGDGSVSSHRAFLGYTDDPDCDIDDYEYKTAATGLPIGMHKYRLTFGPLGAVLYVDGVKGADVDYSQLRDAQQPNSLRFCVGWPNDAGDDSNQERIGWYGVWYTPAGIYAPDYEGGALVTTDMSDIASAQGVSLVPVPGDSWAFIDTQSQSHSGFLETSESAFHMGSALKYFVKVTVEHAEIKNGQSLTVIPYIDDTPMGSTQGVLNTTYTDALIGAQGTSIKVRIAIEDTDPTRQFTNRLRVTRITSRFFPVNSPALHQFFLNCRKGVMCRNNKEWDYDPEAAIRHAFAAADSGEVVEVYNNFTDVGNEETQRFRIESAKLAMGPSDKSGYDRLVGTLVIRMRRVDE